MAKLTPEEIARAEKYLDYISRPNGGIPRIPLRPNDPLANLCGRYLREIGWKPNHPIPKRFKPSIWTMFLPWRW